MIAESVNFAISAKVVVKGLRRCILSPINELCGLLIGAVKQLDTRLRRLENA